MLEHWYNALRSDRGVVLRTTDREALRQKLYAARRDAADEALTPLSIVLSPTANDEVWIIKKGAPNGSSKGD